MPIPFPGWRSAGIQSFRALIDSVPAMLQLQGDEALLTEDSILRLLDRVRFWPAKIHSRIGGKAYYVSLHQRGDIYAGLLTHSYWLRERDYDPPLDDGRIVLVGKDIDKKLVIVSPSRSTDALLGEIKEYCGLVANVPPGWLLCNKANHDAGAVNGITPPNKVNRVTVGAGDAADVTPTDANDRAYTYAHGDSGGYNIHGWRLDTEDSVNDHNYHDNLHQHSHEIALHVPAHLVTVDVGTEVNVVSEDDEHNHAGATGGIATDGEDYKHSETDNRMLYIAHGFIVFVGV